MKKELLLPLLKKEQKKSGYLSEDFLKKLSKKTSIKISRLYGIATFYSFLKTEKQGKNIIAVCNSPSCYVNGSFNILKFLEKKLKLKFGESNKNFSLYKTSCIGCCNKPPAMLLNGKPYNNLTEEKIIQLLKKCRS